MSWFRRRPIDERVLNKGEAEAYSKGHDDGVQMVLDELIELGPDAGTNEVRALVKRLIVSHAVETASDNKAERDK